MADKKSRSRSVTPGAKGDITVGTAANASAVLGVGTDGQLLTAASGQTTGLQWTTISAGATINYQAFTSSTTWTVPSTAKYVDVLVVGGGSGGQGGHRATANTGTIGAGYGGALTMVKDIYLGGTGTVSIVIGAGSSGTSGTSTTTQAATPSSGGYSGFGTYCYSGGGAPSNTMGGVPAYKGTSMPSGNGYTIATDSNQANWAPSLNAMYNAVQSFTSPVNTSFQQSFAMGINSIGYWGGSSGAYNIGSNTAFWAGAHAGMGQTTNTPLGVDVLTNTLPTGIPSIWLNAVGTATAGTSGTGGGAGGAAGITGVAGGGGTNKYGAGQLGGQGGAGAGGGGSMSNPLGSNGGSGGNAGTNTGAGGGAGACTGSTTAGTGGTGGNGAAGLVVVRWIS